MKIMMETTAGLILSGIVLVAVIFLFTGTEQPLLRQIGQRMQTETTDYSAYQDKQILYEACQREAPKIWYKQEIHWKAGEQIAVGQAFGARDADGNSTELKVEDIVDVHGNSLIDQYQKEDATISLSAGSYIFTLKAIDSQKKVTVERIALVVDGKQEAAG